VLGERIERNLYGLLETLIAAKCTKNRQRLLEEANLNLEVLRFQMRLAKDVQCLKVEGYAFAAKSIDEIGRLVGGWLRMRAKSSTPSASRGATTGSRPINSGISPNSSRSSGFTWCSSPSPVVCLFSGN